MRNLVLLLFVGVLASGCAVGNTHRYDWGDANLSIETDKTVAVSILDARSYVQSGAKLPNFVGLQRGGFGVPFGVTTRSGRPVCSARMQVSAARSKK